MRSLAALCLLGVAAAQPLPTLPEAPDEAPEAGVVHVALEAAALPDPTHGYVYGFNGASPGPTLRARRGDTLVVELTNRLDTPTTLHWHGLHVPFAMDGVPWMVDPVAPGETFVYQFPLEQAGTYWYHPHFDTARQVDGGLFGAVIVEDPADPTPPDQVWIADLPLEHDPSAARPEHGHGRLSDAWWINGAPTPLTWAPPAGVVQRIRLINASSTGYLALPALPGVRRIGGDQGLLAAPEAHGPWVLGPGDRADFEWRPVDPAVWASDPYSLNGGPRWGDPWPLVEVTPQGEIAPQPMIQWAFDEAAPSPDGPADLLYVLSGSDRSGQWYINGERFPEVTIHELALGDQVVIEVRNLSPTHHPFHLHGHAFEVVSVDGVPPPHRRLEDTVDLGIGQTLRVRLNATNPGDWMAHCHILPHAEEGMMTVLRVLGE
ncbi:MAG: multicopper oxidase family protein [Myxococcales bacterium]|nr:multicopper oxidase family protein [Myxococcales bacterium]